MNYVQFTEIREYLDCGRHIKKNQFTFSVIWT